MKTSTWRWMLTGIVLAFVLIVFFQSCASYDPTTEQVQAKQSAQIFKEMQAQLGLPNITQFTQKKTLKMIQELCDQEKLITHTYLYNALEGRVGQYLGRSLGYGIPFSAQYTSPDKLVRADVGQYTGTQVVNQADPNGLYMPTSSSATWIILLDKENKPRVIYCEPQIIVSPIKLE
jgi:hypothetical protein